MTCCNSLSVTGLIVIAALASPSTLLAQTTPSVRQALTQNPAAALEEIVVSASLQQGDIARTSLTVVNQRALRARSAQHLEDVLSAAPNTNTASGASRGRFFQIRGIGERSQFVEPVNASVAVLLDGIDLTGLGASATTWDLQQVDILRGPQGTLLGANALAGLINLQSIAPDADPDSPSLRLVAGAENYGGSRLGIAASSALGPLWNGRVAIQQYNSDGYLKNQWLNRQDTNQRDELTGRVTLSRVDEDSRWDVGVYRVDIDNGYDAFSLDNTRSTLSDQPGKDQSTTDAARVRWQRFATINVSAQLSSASTDSLYSYDEDWSYVGIAPDWEYSSFDQYARQRDMHSFELRLDGGSQVSWVAGTYLRVEEETLEREYTYAPGPFNSDLSINTSAVFGQLDFPLSATLSGFIGARIEHRETDYADSNGVVDDLSDTLWSGKGGLQWQASETSSWYVSVSRGVRAGGFNANLLASIQALPETTTELMSLSNFEEESLISTELGWRWRSPQGDAHSELTVFTMQRRNQQVRQSLTIARPDGSTAFIDYTDNAAKGSNSGLEWQFGVVLTPSLSIDGSLGVLDAKFDRYITATGDDLSGRDQPQAPSLMGQLALEWQALSSLALGIELTAMDSYYFSDRHGTRSPSRHLVNAHARWQADTWQLQLWARNLGNEDYFDRGFGSFGNDPRKEYVTEPYYQFGEPRVIGITLEYAH